MFINILNIVHLLLFNILANQSAESAAAAVSDHDYSATSSILDISALSDNQPIDDDAQFAQTFLNSMRYLTEKAKGVQVRVI